MLCSLGKIKKKRGQNPLALKRELANNQCVQMESVESKFSSLVSNVKQASQIHNDVTSKTKSIDSYQTRLSHVLKLETESDLTQHFTNHNNNNNKIEQRHQQEEKKEVKEDEEEVESILKLHELYTSKKQLLENERNSLELAYESASALIALRQDYDKQQQKQDIKTDQSDTEQQQQLQQQSQTTKRRKIQSSPDAGIPLGSQVAFRIGKQRGEEEEWIQCEVTKINADGSRYEVQDPEPDENNNPGQSYKASIKDLILIPISADSSSLPPYPPGSQVLARYPETTTFYKAEVTTTKRDGKCRLKFEGEEVEGKETEVDRKLVLPLPKL